MDGRGVKDRDARLADLLRDVSSGARSIEDAMEQLRHVGFLEMDVARLDLERESRCGAAEVVLAGPKSDSVLVTIFDACCNLDRNTLFTRVTCERAHMLRARAPEDVSLNYDVEAQMLLVQKRPLENRGRGCIAIVTAGSADLPVAREAQRTAEWLGNRVSFHSDVGVAGLHRLLAVLPELRAATVLIAVAGMEGALPSVLAGLVAVPVIAVPTSVGFGTGLGGLAALMSMLNSCAPGLTVVNIDAGFSAGYAAALMNRRGAGT